jgi:hypothetical protein
MAKWNKKIFIDTLKENCKPHIVNIVLELINFSEETADTISWGRGEGHGTMTYKCKSEDWGIVPLFHVTTAGQIKFLLNHMRTKIRKKEILRDYQMKLESNFMLDFGDDVYTSDIYFETQELFHTKTEMTKFVQTINGLTARFHQ